MKTCPSCGAANPDEAAFCSHCAFQFGEVPPPYPPPHAPAPGQPPPAQPPYPYPVTAPRYAGFWIRFAAAFIDGIIVSVALLPLNIVFRAVSDRFYYWGTWDWREGVSLGAVILLNAIRVGVSWAYYTIMTGRYGATLGKMLLRLKVVGEDMNPISYGTAALREIVGKFVSTIVCFIGYIWVVFDERKQGWHDKIAHTFVITEGP